MAPPIFFFFFFFFLKNCMVVWGSLTSTELLNQEEKIHFKSVFLKLDNLEKFRTKLVKKGQIIITNK
jgi:ABC-type sugar transport system permease subunit